MNALALGFALLVLPVNDNATALAPVAGPVRFLVTRRGPGVEVKRYPLFDDREMAEWVAQRASEKYRGAVVELEPVAGDRR